ncbi:MAG: Hpt domain-containing protein [Pseudomonadales bacterium]|nr:Hpt domain-containing protein [Pseudomonadales bacterium]
MGMNVTWGTLATLPVFDEMTISSLRDIMGEDFDDLLQTFMTDADVRMDSVRQAIDSGDAEALRKAAHSFKGSSVNVGARRLSEVCRMLEDALVQGQQPDAQEFLVALTREYEQVVESVNRLRV